MKIKASLFLLLICSVHLLGACGGGVAAGNNGGGGGNKGGGGSPQQVVTHFSVSAPSSANPGVSFSFTVTALDAANQVVTTYSGTVRFASTDGKATLPPNSTLTNGSGNFLATLNTAGNQTITATDISAALITGTSFSIQVNSLTITSGPSPNGTVGVDYGTPHGNMCNIHHNCFYFFQLTASENGGNWTWAAAPHSSLPPGLACCTLTSETTFPGPVGPVTFYPVIFGTPTAAGSFEVTVTVSESPGVQASATYTITINAANTADEATANTSAQHHHYKLIDIGTFGGPASSINSPLSQGTLNNRGMAVGWSATSVPTLSTSSFLICGGLDGLVPFITHSFLWGGAVKDLGAFPPSETNCSEPFFMNSKGEVVGASETADIDPQFFGLQQIHAVRWKDGQMTDLGSLGGNQVAAWGINDHGQIVGSSTNTIPDPYCFFGTVQNRAFIWENGRIRDLGTLGGNCVAIGNVDANIHAINESGQIVGGSTTSTTANHLTGIPTWDPFLWEEGKGMIDLGTLGGAYGGAQAINNHGQIIGQSGIADDPGACNGFPDIPDLNCHGFLWDRGTLTDLTTSSIGGSPNFLAAINDRGEIIGWGVFPSSALEAFLWRDGRATDLGHLDGCFSFTTSINFRSQVVGATIACDGTTLRAFLWELGSMVDLNTLIPAGSNLQLIDATNINDRGEIVGDGVPLGTPMGPFDDVAFLLIPCDENHPNLEGCDYSLVEDSAVSSHAATIPTTQGETRATPDMIERARQLMRSSGIRANPWFRPAMH